MKTTVALVLALAATAAVADDCPAETQAAVRFMDGYLRYSRDRMEKRTHDSTASWLRHSPLASAELTTAYRALEREGFRQDPQLGWDIDLLLDAQDSPDAGFKSYACHGPSLVELQGIDWPDFHLVLRVVRRHGRLVVDGVGRVNVPPSQRAKR